MKCTLVIATMSCVAVTSVKAQDRPVIPSPPTVIMVDVNDMFNPQPELMETQGKLDKAKESLENLKYKYKDVLAAYKTAEEFYRQAAVTLKEAKEEYELFWTSDSSPNPERKSGLRMAQDAVNEAMKKLPPASNPKVAFIYPTEATAGAVTEFQSTNKKWLEVSGRAQEISARIRSDPRYQSRFEFPERADIVSIIKERYEEARQQESDSKALTQKLYPSFASAEEEIEDATQTVRVLQHERDRLDHSLKLKEIKNGLDNNAKEIQTLNSSTLLVGEKISQRLTDLQKEVKDGFANTGEKIDALTAETKLLTTAVSGMKDELARAVIELAKIPLTPEENMLRLLYMKGIADALREGNILQSELLKNVEEVKRELQKTPVILTPIAPVPHLEVLDWTGNCWVPRRYWRR